MNFSLVAFWKLTRLEHSLLTLVGVAVGWLLAQPMNAHPVLTLSLILTLIAYGIGPALLTAGAFALNDYHGYETDRTNGRRDRPIVAGKISLNDAKTIATTLLVIGVVLSLPFGFNPFAISLLFAIGSLLYDPVLKKLPLIGNIFISTTMAIPFVYGALIAAPTLNKLVLVLTAIAILVGIGREIINTTRDIRGDRAIGAKTLPILLGANLSIKIASAFILAAVALSIMPFLWTKNNTYVAVVSICDALLIWAVITANENPNDSDKLKKTRNYTLLALGVGLIAFLTLIL